jgi:hypothetical protein
MSSPHWPKCGNILLAPLPTKLDEVSDWSKLKNVFNILLYYYANFLLIWSVCAIFHRVSVDINLWF